MMLVWCALLVVVDCQPYSKVMRPTGGGNKTKDGNPNWFAFWKSSDHDTGALLVDVRDHATVSARTMVAMHNLATKGGFSSARIELWVGASTEVLYNVSTMAHICVLPPGFSGWTGKSYALSHTRFNRAFFFDGDAWVCGDKWRQFVNPNVDVAWTLGSPHIADWIRKKNANFIEKKEREEFDKFQMRNTGTIISIRKSELTTRWLDNITRIQHSFDALGLHFKGVEDQIAWRTATFMFRHDLQEQLLPQHLFCREIYNGGGIEKYDRLLSSSTCDCVASGCAILHDLYRNLKGEFECRDAPRFDSCGRNSLLAAAAAAASVPLGHSTLGTALAPVLYSSNQTTTLLPAPSRLINWQYRSRHCAVFVHLPKAAGMTVLSILRQAFGDIFECHGRDLACAERLIVEEKHQKQSFHVFFGTNMESLRDVLAPRHCSWYTFVRNPISLAVSSLMYCRAMATAGKRDQLCEELAPPKTGRLMRLIPTQSLYEFAEHRPRPMLNVFGLWSKLNNTLAHAGADWRALHEDSKPWHYRPVWSLQHLAYTNESALDDAMTSLRSLILETQHFTAVGVMDRFEESMVNFDAYLPLPGGRKWGCEMSRLADTHGSERWNEEEAHIRTAALSDPALLLLFRRELAIYDAFDAALTTQLRSSYSRSKTYCSADPNDANKGEGNIFSGYRWSSPLKKRQVTRKLYGASNVSQLFSQNDFKPPPEPSEITRLLGQSKNNFNVDKNFWVDADADACCPSPPRTMLITGGGKGGTHTVSDALVRAGFASAHEAAFNRTRGDTVLVSWMAVAHYAVAAYWGTPRCHALVVKVHRAALDHISSLAAGFFGGSLSCAHNQQLAPDDRSFEFASFFVPLPYSPSAGHPCDLPTEARTRLSLHYYVNWNLLTDSVSTHSISIEEFSPHWVVAVWREYCVSIQSPHWCQIELERAATFAPCRDLSGRRDQAHAVSSNATSASKHTKHKTLSWGNLRSADLEKAVTAWHLSKSYGYKMPKEEVSAMEQKWPTSKKGQKTPWSRNEAPFLPRTKQQPSAPHKTEAHQAHQHQLRQKRSTKHANHQVRLLQAHADDELRLPL